MPRKPKFQHRKKREREKRFHEQSQTQSLVSTVTRMISSESSLRELQASITLPSRAWTDQSSEGLERMVLCKLTDGSSSSSVEPRVTHCLTVNADRTWKLTALEQDVSGCVALASLPASLTPETLSQLILRVDGLHLCAGQSDLHFVDMIRAKKGKITSRSGKIACSLDDTACPTTLRTSSCEILCSKAKCSSCTKYSACNLESKNIKKWLSRYINVSIL